MQINQNGETFSHSFNIIFQTVNDVFTCLIIPKQLLTKNDNTIEINKKNDNHSEC